MYLFISTLITARVLQGMDPRSQRLIWDLLKKKRSSRVILLSSHFMDEVGSQDAFKYQVVF